MISGRATSLSRDKQCREMAQILVSNDGVSHVCDLRQISKQFHASVASSIIIIIIIIFKTGFAVRVKGSGSDIVFKAVVDTQ